MDATRKNQTGFVQFCRHLSLPNKPKSFQRLWHPQHVGENSLTARGGTIPTLTTYYASTSAMASAPNVCPITSGKIFCHPDAVSFVNTVEKRRFPDFIPDFGTQYYNEMELTIGAGDTTNTIWTVPGTELRV